MSFMSLTAEDVGNRQSRDVTSLLALWEERRADRALPRFEEIGFKAIGPWLDRIVLIRTDFRAQEFRFHFVGVAAERYFGRNVTGASAISTLGTQEYVSLVRYLDAVQSRRRPIHSVIPHMIGLHMEIPNMGIPDNGNSQTGKAGRHGSLERLLLPCSDGASVSAVILFLQPGEGDRPSRYAVL